MKFRFQKDAWWREFDFYLARANIGSAQNCVKLVRQAIEQPYATREDFKWLWRNGRGKDEVC